MEFLKARPDIVESPTQRNLLSYWHRARGTNPLPIWKGLEEPELVVMADNLAYAEMVGTEDQHRLLVVVQGARLMEVHGGYMVGKYIDEILRPPYREQSLATCREAIVGKLPVYTLLDLRDRNERIVHFERLLLPFSLDGSQIHGLMVSIEISSPEGPYERWDLMNEPLKPPSMALCATILH